MNMNTRTDTTPEAEAVQIELLRQASPARRFAVTCSLSAQVVALARRAIARVQPDLNTQELDMLFVEYKYGRELAEHLRKFLEQRNNAS